jgi:WD40 repeat protein
MLVLALGTRLAENSACASDFSFTPLDSSPANPRVRIITTQQGSAAFSPDGRRLLIGPATRSGSVEIWNVQSGKKVSTLAKSAGVIQSVAWSPDGHWAAAAGASKQITVWDARTGKPAQVLKGHTEIVQSIAFSPDGRLLASGSSDKTARIWDLAKGAVVRTLAQPTPTERSQSIVGISGMVFAIAFSPDGKMLVSGGGDGAGQAGDLVLWDPETGKQLRRLAPTDGRQVWAVAFSPDGHVLASGTIAGAVTLYDVPAGEVRHEFRGTGQLRSMAISHNGRMLAAGIGRDIELWEVNTGKVTQSLHAQGRFIGSLDFSGDGKLLAFGDAEGIKLWKLAE